MYNMSDKEILGVVGAVLAVLVGLGGYALYNTITTDTNPWDDARKVSVDLGGPVFERWADYIEMGVDGQKLQIHGPCASACTFFLKTVPLENVCYGEHAMLGFHGASARGITGPIYIESVTRFMLNVIYPEHVKDWLLERWDPTEQVDDPNNLDLIWTSPATFGVQKCEDVL